MKDYKFKKILSDDIYYIIYRNVVTDPENGAEELDDYHSTLLCTFKCDLNNFYSKKDLLRSKATINFFNNFEVYVDQTPHQAKNYALSKKVINTLNTKLTNNLRSRIVRALEYNKTGSSKEYLKQCAEYDKVKEIILNEKAELERYRRKHSYAFMSYSRKISRLEADLNQLRTGEFDVPKFLKQEKKEKVQKIMEEMAEKRKAEKEHKKYQKEVNKAQRDLSRL